MSAQSSWVDCSMVEKVAWSVTADRHIPKRFGYAGEVLALALVVLNHVTVIDVARGVAVADRAVEIEGTRIRSVIAAAGYRPPAGAEVHELSGRYVVPGFADMHAHVLFP